MATCCCPGEQIRSQTGDTNDSGRTSSFNSSATVSSSNFSKQKGSVLCSSCVNAYLQEARQRRQRVWKEHARLKAQCQEALDKSPPVAELEHEFKLLQKKSETLRATSNQLALETAKITCQNEERQAALQKNPIAQQRDWLSRWQTSLLDEQHGALSCGVIQARQNVRRVRFQWAVAAFQMYRLDVSEVQRMTPRMKHARGIGKIGGLPLPHAGPELYGVLPPIELQSALRLVASLTSLVASCLGIRLPHPILLTPNGSIRDLASQGTASAYSNENNLLPSSKQQQANTPVETEARTNSLSSSTASLASLVGQTAQRVLSSRNGLVGSFHTSAIPSSSKQQQQQQQQTQSLLLPQSLDTTTVQQRVHHATCAVLAEKSDEGPSQHHDPNHGSRSKTTTYSLSVAAMQQQSDGDEFAIALQLLQNNIVSLCIHAGAPVDRLSPAEAVLLNLHVLHEFCLKQAMMS